MANGTQLTGYMPPEEGPFRCDNCKHFKAPYLCDEKKVIADPEIRKVKEGGKTYAGIEPAGCCNEFKSSKRLGEVSFGSVGL